MEDLIPFHRPYPLSEDDNKDISWKIEDVLFTGQLTNGNNVRELEDKIAKLYNVDYCVATSSCTMGLMLCVKYTKPYAIQLPAFNWFSDKYILDFMKIEPRYTDIDFKTWLPKQISVVRALYLHTFGNIGISDANETIYDASHALGADLKDIGLATVFSLAPSKIVTSCEGGLIITNNKGLYDFVKERRDKMCRMSEVHAIIGLQNLFYLVKVKDWKKEVYNYYKNFIPGQFQEIPYNSTYNTIGFLNLKSLKIPEHIETRQYYKPLAKLYTVITDYVYNNIVCLPSWYGVDYKKVVDDILKENG